ncbi:MAG: RnfABCDGE type electron transport complex subunit B [Candidatus Omnitrophota bacterium]
MNAVILALLSLSGLGFCFGLLLAWASKKFQLKVDPRIIEINDLLPQANCGACGLAGCTNFAEALVEEKVELNACVVCSSDNKKQIAHVLGLDSEGAKLAARLAVVSCGGGVNCKDKFEYRGLKDCRVAVLTMQGNKQCRFACVGQGSCVDVCPFNAIKMADTGLPIIDQAACRGCQKCVAICPRQLIFMIDREKKIYINCNSHDKGFVVTKNCKVGCIGCGKCVKTCPTKAIKLVDNLAVIDYKKCINCTKCVKECPTKTIAIL